VKCHGLYLLDRIYPSEMVFEFHGAGRIDWICLFSQFPPARNALACEAGGEKTEKDNPFTAEENSGLFC